MKKKWWMEAVGYQIYPRSFYDSNGDGIGDINGVIRKLDYLKDLGINMIWLCPFYKSPMDDNGYDVSDYFDIAKEYGTLEDVKNLIREAHDRDIKVVADLVLNHTSDEHPWFIESRKSKDNPYRDYYIWKPGKIDENGLEVEPTNWASFFGGSAWRKNELTNEYYMKIFSNKMPDLNWKNENLREEIYKMTTWWIDTGIDGFRVDAVSHIARDNSFSDSKKENDEKYVGDWNKFSNLPKVHDHLKELNEKVLSKYDVMTVGEVGGDATVEDALKYAGFDSDEFNMVFNFSHNWCNNGHDAKNYDEIETDLIKLKKALSKWQEGLYSKAWNPLYWLNHDHPRVASMYGNIKEYHNKSCKMLCNSLYFMWGTPFIYNGEEIGMTNYPFTKIEEFNDVAIHNQYNILKAEGKNTEEFLTSIALRSRDNARTPMQWNKGENAGFTSGKPWMKVNPNKTKINVEDQLKDDDSILSHYKKVIELRKNREYKDVIVYGDYKLLDKDNETVYSYLRSYNDKKILVISNFFDVETTLNIDNLYPKKIIISNYSDSSSDLSELTLRPFESIIFEV